MMDGGAARRGRGTAKATRRPTLSSSCRLQAAAAAAAAGQDERTELKEEVAGVV